MKNKINSDFDIMIAGGGLVGSSLACALAGQGFRIGVFEASGRKTGTTLSGYDARVIALSAGSRVILKTLGLWDSLAQSATPINSIHVSNRGSFGSTRLKSSDYKLPALGYVIKAQHIDDVLYQYASSHPDVSFYHEASITSFKEQSNRLQVNVNQKAEPVNFNTKLLVAADGGHSTVRRHAGIGTVQHEYEQVAVFTNVTTEHPHRGVAYERFTDSGPMALLPMPGNHCALVWTLHAEDADRVSAWDDVTFLNKLQQRFGTRLGKFTKVGVRHSFPLSLMRTKKQVSTRLAVIGNAAHTLHPVAGQGLNLGLRDVATLAEVLVDAEHNGHDIGESQILKTYADWREYDQHTVTAISDILVRSFSNRFKPLSFSRTLGLTMMDWFPLAKKSLAMQAAGLSGRLPRISRGVPL